jgi:hypothetical protein
MSETQNRLTPDLVVMAVETGMLDQSLPALRDVIATRLEIIERRTASQLNVGDRFFIKDCRPKYWNDLEVEFIKYDGQWLVCKIFHDYDRTMLQRRRGIGNGQIRLRTSHVGDITHQTEA